MSPISGFEDTSYYEELRTALKTDQLTSRMRGDLIGILDDLIELLEDGQINKGYEYFSYLLSE